MRFKDSIYFLVASISLNIGILSLAQASLVTVSTTGVIGEGYDSANVFLSGLNLAGSRFSMTTEFDPALLPFQVVNDSERSGYCLSCSIPFSISLAINGITRRYVGDSSNGYFSFVIENGVTQYGQGGIDRISSYVSGYSGGVPLGFSQTLQAAASAMNLELSYQQSRSLIPQPTDSWSTRFQYPSVNDSLYFYVGNGGGIPDLGSISDLSLNSNPIPEPSTRVLLFVGGLALLYTALGLARTQA